MKKLSTGVFILSKNFLRISPVIFLLSWFCVSCGGGSFNMPSIEFDSCFANYKNKQELSGKIQELSDTLVEEQPNYPIMAVLGCMNYQLGSLPLAEELLNRAYMESGDDENTQKLAASALGLIYLKHKRQKEIQPYIKPAKDHHLGRWMIVLYYIDSYRAAADRGHLKAAGDYIEKKHNEEGSTSATRRFLKQIRKVQSMDTVCYSLEEADGISPDCPKKDFQDEKRYLFSTAHGFLSMLLKEEPFNEDII